MPNLSNRKGFALPMAILVIAVLSAALAAGFASGASEVTTNAAERGQNRAYNFAQAGLESFLARRNETGYCDHCGDPIVVDSEWTHVNFVGGYADVVARKVRPAIDSNTPAIYFIRSKGIDTTVKLNGANRTVVAERTVGVYAQWTTATMDVLAAWVSLSGLNKNGTGVISGIDHCGQKPDVAGVTTPRGDLHIQGESFNPEGTPPVDTSANFASLRGNVHIDWDGIVNQNAVAADYTIPQDGFPSASWFDAHPDAWPVIRVHTNGYSLPNRGRGMIIADSNFTISGSNMWDGIVLVGGRLTSNGNNTTAGATLSGLNFLIGGTPSSSSVDDSDANGQKTYVYDSCNVSKASSGMRRYTALTNTWMDNVASW
jgi:hypothetical protein